MKHWMLVAVLTFTPALLAQESIPRGTILPVQLNTSVTSDRARLGQIVSARVMQDVPLAGGARIKAGTKVLGRIVAAQGANDPNRAKIALRFDTLTTGNRRTLVTTNLRAMASMLEVNEAQVPQTGPDRGTSEFTWNTEQIGGEADYHGSMIALGLQVVGQSLPLNGALVEVSAKQGTKCRANLDDNRRLQATWLFASDACGLYGFPNLMLAHAGRTTPVGEIVLTSDKGNVDIRAGSGMLLRVN
jgi:hypothetical protein